MERRLSTASSDSNISGRRSVCSHASSDSNISGRRTVCSHDGAGVGVGRTSVSSIGSASGLTAARGLHGGAGVAPGRNSVSSVASAASALEGAGMHTRRSSVRGVGDMSDVAPGRASVFGRDSISSGISAARHTYDSGVAGTPSSPASVYHRQSGASFASTRASTALGGWSGPDHGDQNEQPNRAGSDWHEGVPPRRAVYLPNATASTFGMSSVPEHGDFQRPVGAVSQQTSSVPSTRASTFAGWSEHGDGR